MKGLPGRCRYYLVSWKKLGPTTSRGEEGLKTLNVQYEGDRGSIRA